MDSRCSCLRCCGGTASSSGTSWRSSASGWQRAARRSLGPWLWQWLVMAAGQLGGSKAAPPKQQRQQQQRRQQQQQQQRVARVPSGFLWFIEPAWTLAAALPSALATLAGVALRRRRRGWAAAAARAVRAVAGAGGALVGAPLDVLEAWLVLALRPPPYRHLGRQLVLTHRGLRPQVAPLAAYNRHRWGRPQVACGVGGLGGAAAQVACGAGGLAVGTAAVAPLWAKLLAHLACPPRMASPPQVGRLEQSGAGHLHIQGAQHPAVPPPPGRARVRGAAGNGRAQRRMTSAVASA
jgi:hypothetical protein